MRWIGLSALWLPLEYSVFDLCRKVANIPRMYLHRYLRYTPTLALMILCFTSLTKFFSSGPFFGELFGVPLAAHCEKYWWTALLHISVYTNPLSLVRGTKCFEKLFSFLTEDSSSVMTFLGISL